MASRKILVNIDLTKNEIQNAVVQNLAAAPSSPVEGQIYYDTGDHTLYIRTNSTWVDLAASGSGGISAVVEDLTPQLGGDLDGQGNSITDVTAIEVDTVSSHTAASLELNSPDQGNAITVDNDGSINLAPTNSNLVSIEDETSTNKAFIDPSNLTGDHTLTLPDDDGTVALTSNSLSDFQAPTGDLDINSNKLTNVTDPTSAQDAATKAYVDATTAGIDWKKSVRVASTANGTLATAFENGDTVDGVTLATGDRILLKDQSTGAENGIYTVNASGAPTRATDADSSAEVTGGLAVFVEEGTTNADTGWVLTNNGAITVGSTALTFTQFTGLGQVTAGTGLAKSGNTISIENSGVLTVPHGGTGVATITGLVKGNGTSAFSAATSGTDYAPATSGTSILKGNGSGGFSNATSGTDYAPATSGTSILKGNGSGGFSNAASGTDYAPATAVSTQLKGNGSGGFTAGSYAANVGDNSSTSIAVTHSLGTRDVAVQVYDSSTYETVECDVVRTSTSVVTLTFSTAPATNAYRAVVIAV